MTQEAFRLVRSFVDVGTFRAEIEAYGAAWSEARAKAISYHTHTRAIHLRREIVPPGGTAFDCETEAETEDYARFPRLTAFLEQFALEEGAELARATIVALEPSRKVYRHSDPGLYYARSDRYHLVVQSEGGTLFYCGGEERIWREGEVWWFDNKRDHEARNLSDTAERIHVIFDLRPRSWRAKVRKIVSMLR
jgi:quercetin dioxygenase-like cupin family protein